MDELGIDCKSYCEMVHDPILMDFSNGYTFNYSGWLQARELRKTGYGNSLTTGMLGAVYLPDNAKRFISELHDALRNSENDFRLKAVWYSSKVPLWGANSSQLVKFNRDIGKILDNYTDDKSARISLLHPGDNHADNRLQRKRHLGRFSNGIGLSSNANFDRLELLLIPGVIGLVQYHGQPNTDSALTLPIGYITTDPERLQLLEKLLIKRIDGALATISWSENTNETLGSLLSDELLEKLDRRSGDDVDQAIIRKQKTACGDAVRGILSLRKKV